MPPGVPGGLLDWLQNNDQGMTIGCGDGQLLIGLSSWVPVAPVQPTSGIR